MPNARRVPRIVDTTDLSVSLRSGGRRWMDGRVLNLSEGGMLIAGSRDLDVAGTANFELVGPGFCYDGVVEIVHRAAGAVGLRFLSWAGATDRSVRALVSARLGAAQLGSHDPDELAVGCGADEDSDGYEGVALPGLSAVIEWSPAACASRHEVLHLSERELLVECLALPLGARISFVLAGEGINHVGDGRVAHRTGRIAGVAVDHWEDSPEAIRALVHPTGEQRSRGKATGLS
jgi:hypothetical protein